MVGSPNKFTMALSDELSEVLAKTVKQDEAWTPYLGPNGGEGWQNTVTGEVRYQQDPPGEVAEGYDEEHWSNGDDSNEWNEWSEALSDEGWESLSDVPEGTKIHYIQNGNHYDGRIVGIEDEEGSGFFEVRDDGFLAGVTPDQVEEVLELPHEEDDGPIPLEPREDPYEFEDELTEEDLRDLDIHTRDIELWGPKLEYTPFDSLGEVPIGTTVEFDSRKVNGTITGEVTGYIDYDAEIGETNSLRVQTDDEYVGETTVGPSNFVRFVGPEDGEADMEEYLQDPFRHATNVTSARDAGIGDGNTTGERMEILTMPDDSRVFITPVEAYDNISTGVVSGSNEARRNNLNSPIMIDHLGGGTCETSVVEGEAGTEYIAKEGIEGDLLKERQWDIDSDEDAELIDSLERTLATAFFVGNQDLHGANVMVNFETQEATIIDHDNAGPDVGGWMDIHRLARGPASTQNIEEEIYEICRGYMRSEVGIPEELEGTFHESYFKKALDSVVNDEGHEAVFEPWESSPHETLEGYDNMDLFEEGMEVTVFTGDGHVRRATLTDQYEGTWYGESEDGYEVSFDIPHHVLEVNSRGEQ